MRKTALFILFLIIQINLTAQETKWMSVNIDEVLTVSLPIGFTQTDTTIKDQTTIAYSKIIESNIQNCTLYISIDSANIALDIKDKKSALISLDGIGEGVCNQYSQAGYKCERGDTAVDRIPGKRFLIYENQTQLILYGYVFRANNKTYKIFSTTNTNIQYGLRPSELNKLLGSVKFNTDNIKEYKFYSQLESLNNNSRCEYIVTT